MTRVVVLDSRAHRELRIQARAAAELGDDQRFVPVVVGEFPLLVVHYPVLLSKDADTGAFYCGAMLGFDPGENLFLGEDGHDAYRPLNLQRGPFYTAGSDLAIDLDNPRVGAGMGEALFDHAGAPTPYLQSIMALMRDLQPGLARTKVFLQTLLELKIVEPMTIDAVFDDGTRREVTDLYTIDKDAFRALPDTAVVELFRRGYLQLIYLLIASLKQVPVLAQRKNRRFLHGSGGGSAASLL
ncbi:MAG TPA: SapC family protein [Steroidobacteraceae bacterium]|nr:SapC family protein [Steroidobacteraceae bacterium]